jgi:hypothetical protein
MMFKYLIMVSFLFVSCGRNNGTPEYAPTTNDGNATPRAKIDGLDLAQTVLSKDGHWRMKITWLNGPHVNEDQPIENKVQLFFVTPSGAMVDTVKDLSVIPFMPSMGHGIGNRKPIITVGDLGIAEVRGLWLMAGDWEFTVKATVDGVADTAVFHADVTAK